MKKIQQNCIQCIRPISELRTRDRCYVGKNFTHSMRFTEFLKKILVPATLVQMEHFYWWKKVPTFWVVELSVRRYTGYTVEKTVCASAFLYWRGGSLRRGWICDFKLENVQNELKLRIRKKWIDLIFESIRNSRN